MHLDGPLLSFFKTRATEAGVALPATDDDLFASGVLDSFSLADLVTVLEGQFGIRVPDADIVPARFQTLAAIDRYVDAAPRAKS